MRSVYPSAEVAHKWAHAAQDHARNGTGSVFFNGSTIYSYGGHWPIARIWKRRNKGTLVLVNSRRASVTTSGHTSMVRSAVRHMTTLDVLYPSWDSLGRADGARELNAHKANLAYIAAEVARLHKEATRAMLVQSVEWRRAEVVRLGQAYTRYVAFFGLRRAPLRLPDFAPLVDRAERIEHNPRTLARREYLAARDASIKAARVASQFWPRMATRSDWRLGGAFTGNHWYTDAQGEPVMLRVEGEDIKTSQGARIPLATAPMVWALVERGRATGGWHRSGLREVKIGDFAVDSVDPDGTLRVGCHVIPHSELRAMARQLGLA